MDKTKNLVKKFFKSRLKLHYGSRLVSFLFITASMLIAAGILFGANMYYDIDTSEVVVQEIQRVTNVIRATTGLIAGGSATQNPASGYKLEVVGSTLFSGTTMVGNVSDAAQELRFTEGGASAAQYIGLKAPSSLTTDRIYILPHHDTNAPSGDYVLTWQTGNQLQWKDVTATGGAGDITAVGSMTTGDVFAGTNASGQWLGLGASAGRIAFDDQATDYVNILGANVGIGTATPAQKLSVAGTFGILEGGTSPTYYTVFQGGDQLGTITYTLPVNAGSSNYVLSTDGSGNLSWASVSGVGGISGTGAANQVTFWTGTSSVSGENDFWWDSTNNRLGIGTNSPGSALDVVGNVLVGANGSMDTRAAGTLTIGGTTQTGLILGRSGQPLTLAGLVQAFTLAGNITGSGTVNITGISQFSGVTYTGPGAVTLSSGAGESIILDPASGTIQLATGDVIKTPGGHSIRASGEQILREVIPIFGFDLPSRTASITYVTVSRTIEDYPFATAMAGTTRVHKLIIRYADTLDPADATPAYRVSNWQVWNVTLGAQTSTFNVPASPSTDDAGLEKGNAYITSVTLPTTTTDDWRLDVKLPTTDKKIHIYQIFLAAYDQVN